MSLYDVTSLPSVPEEAETLYLEFLRLSRLDKLVIMYKESGLDVQLLLNLFRIIKQRGMNEQDIMDVMKYVKEIPHLKDMYEQLIKDVDDLDYKKCKFRESAQNHAALLQIHPLEIVGRAKDTDLSSIAPDDDILARVYLLTLAITAKYTNLITIQFDTFHREYVIQNPELVYASDDIVYLNNNVKPADLLGLIVVDADGSIVPISYGFSKQYELCNINSERLSEAWPEYVRDGRYIAFRKLCQNVFREISIPRVLPFFNWYEVMITRSYVPVRTNITNAEL